MLTVIFPFLQILQLIADTAVLPFECSLTVSRSKSNVLDALMLGALIFVDYVTFQFVRCLVFVAEIITYFSCSNNNFEVLYIIVW